MKDLIVLSLVAGIGGMAFLGVARLLYDILVRLWAWILEGAERAERADRLARIKRINGRDMKRGLA